MIKNIFSLAILSGIILSGFVNYIQAQNKEQFYNFSDLPQSLLLNPATPIDFKIHVGMPMLSQFHVNVGSSGFSVHDVFGVNDISPTDKLYNLVNTVNSDDHIITTQELHLLDIGFTTPWDKNLYLSFGSYQTTDIITYLPTSIFLLGLEGNIENPTTEFSGLNTSTEVLMTYHLGFRKQVNNQLSIGGRLKVYSSMLRIDARNTQGALTTQRINDGNNIYRHTLTADLDIETSGINTFDADEIDDNDNLSSLRNLLDIDDDRFINELQDRALFSGNLGIGVDIGINYNIDEQTSISASINDLGFIRYRKDIYNIRYNMSYTYEGINLLNATSIDIQEDLEENLEQEANGNSYTKWRPTTLRAGIAHSFSPSGKSSAKRGCYCNGFDRKASYYRGEFGGQGFLQTRPKSSLYALTAYASWRLLRGVRFKATYTVDNYSFYNVGLLGSFDIWKLNLYFGANNILNYPNISKAQAIALQFGMNIIL